MASEAQPGGPKMRLKQMSFLDALHGMRVVYVDQEAKAASGERVQRVSSISVAPVPTRGPGVCSYLRS